MIQIPLGASKWSLKICRKMKWCEIPLGASKEGLKILKMKTFGKNIVSAAFWGLKVFKMIKMVHFSLRCIKVLRRQK